MIKYLEEIFTIKNFRAAKADVDVKNMFIEFLVILIFKLGM